MFIFFVFPKPRSAVAHVRRVRPEPALKKKTNKKKKLAFRCVEEVMEEEEDNATGKNRKVMGAGWMG